MANECVDRTRDGSVDETPIGDRLTAVYKALLRRYGPQDWWPGDSPFEMMVGAVLTQAASWTNVEKAIANLKGVNALSPKALRELGDDDLARLVYPSGYYNAKARKLKALAEFIGAKFDDDIGSMAHVETGIMRAQLLQVYGIGEETADDILLYPLGKPVFVIDTYARRLLHRLGLAPEAGSYALYQNLFIRHLAEDRELYSEYHALIVRHGRETCQKRPVCSGCCLLDVCPTGQAAVAPSPT